MFKKTFNMFRIFICCVLVAQLMGCGTILYPERKGQKNGKIDAGVAILDGLGVLFFIVPGVIAFGVDFYNGTIYLPGTGSGPDVRATIQKAGEDLKSTGRDVAADIRHNFQ